jgi:hypothetical protein
MIPVHEPPQYLRSPVLHDGLELSESAKRSVTSLVPP